ncbi:hypothetical protein MRX96_039794 [Rhipicephalus microplus]
MMGTKQPKTNSSRLRSSLQESELLAVWRYRSKRRSSPKRTNARVKTRASPAGTHDAGSTKNAGAQAEIDEIPHVSFTRNPNYDAPPPGYPFPTVPMFQLPSPQPSEIISTTTVHTHQHHHHYHEGQNNVKIAYLLPNSGDARRVGSAQVPKTATKTKSLWSPPLAHNACLCTRDSCTGFTRTQIRPRT